MKIYLIRHGRQCSKRCNVNVDLDENGYRQAALLGERLAYAQIERVYSSDLLRARQTAMAANLYWHAEHLVYPELNEISFGDMEGMTDEEIAVTYRDFKIEQDKMLTDLPYPGGECAKDVADRGMPVLKKIAEENKSCAAVVTHGGFIRSIVAHLIGMDLSKARLIGSSLENCSITELNYQPDKNRFTLERFNDYAHLEKYPQLLRQSWVDTEN